MKKVCVTVNRKFTIGKSEKTLFSSFIEHMGRCVYGGIYDPAHPSADRDGFRKDVMDAISELGVSMVRYPGGNFVSGYDWKKAIGPVEQRKATLNLAWNQLEPNKIGVDEFMRFSEKTGTKPIMAVNLGTGGAESAVDLVEYCNLETDTEWAEKRKENGHAEPYGIQYWCLGNEMDGDWQICHRTADEYGQIAAETAKMMKWVDPSIKLTICGSSDTAMPTFPSWDRIVLEQAYPYIDYISLHKYYEYPGGDRTRKQDFLASYVDLDGFISTVASTIRYVKTLKRSQHEVYISLDEWNVWHKRDCFSDRENRGISVAREECLYDFLDAVVFSTLICTFVNHADVVKIACLAQLVNVLAPIMTKPSGELIKQSIFHPFMLASHYCVGEVYQTMVTCDTFSSMYGEAKEVVATAVGQEDGGVCLLVVSLSEEEISLDLELEQFGKISPKENIFLAEQKAGEKAEGGPVEQVKIQKEKLESTTVLLRPYSINFIRLAC